MIQEANARHLHGAGAAPSAWICRWGCVIPAGGTVIDVACGAGRHARWFAERGCEVTAVDRNPAIEATLAGVDRVTCVVADLEADAWPFGAARFDAVVVANYLHRPLLPQLVASVAAGGLLIYETFAAGNERFGRPSNPDFLLQPGELLEAVRGRLRVIGYEDLEVDLPSPAMIQRIAARRER